MNRIPTEGLRVRLLAVAGVLIATALLTWLLRDVVRDAIVRPISFLFWFIGLLLRSVPERVLLVALTIFGAIVAARALLTRPPAEPTYGAPSEPRRGEESRLRFWQIQYRYAPSSSFAAEKLAAELRILLLEMLEHRERMTRDEVLNAATNGTLDLPAPVRALLLEQTMQSNDGQSTLRTLLRRVRSLLGRPAANEPPSAYERELAAIVAFMEQTQTQ